MRGKGAVWCRRDSGDRITPAHAGKSHDLGLALAPGEDHPRPCGEKQRIQLVECAHHGSPPPMRGKVVLCINNVRTYRITPAHAGKSARFAFWYLSYRDHPRPCGEKPSSGHTSASIRGSPPPMRGKDIQNIGCIFEHRITPAHAGKRVKYCNAEVHLKDHPRPCGEKPFWR